MMIHKQLLHELLEQDQEPFLLKTYIADKRSQLINNSSPNNASFSSFLDSQSPPISRCESPGDAVFLRVPSKTAAVLVEAASRIKKQPHSNLKTRIEHARLRVFGSVFKLLKDQRILRNYGRNERAELQESQFCSTSPIRPFRFSLCRNLSSSGRRAPECYSPVNFSSVRRRAKQENEWDCINGVKEEQCSPVSVLERSFEDDRLDAEEDYQRRPYCTSARIDITKQQLLKRLRRFEELAAQFPIELEPKFLVDHSDDEFQIESTVSDCDDNDDDDKQLAPCRKRRSTLEHNHIDATKVLKVWEKGTIMVVELDKGWEEFGKEMEEMVVDVQVDILGALMEELSTDLFMLAQI